MRTMIAGSILDEPVAVVPERSVMVRHPDRAFHWAEQMLLAVAAIFYALHFLHLRADFPNHSPWQDWAKYTDEGWYGDAAVRHYLWGNWNVSGDFNPGAALPVWPLIELALFRVTGVSLVAARTLTVVIFGLILAASYWLARRWTRAQSDFVRPSLAPPLAMLLLATSPFCYAFTRMAILEPLLILLALCALLLADCGNDARERLDSTGNGSRLLPLLALGLILPAIVLTKTTGLFLFPAIFFVLWSRNRGGWTQLVRSVSIVCGIAAALWGAYYCFFVRPHFLADYRYLFDANAYTRITAGTLWSVLQETVMDGTAIGDALFWSSLIAMGAWLIAEARNRSRGPSLPVALAIWVLGYAAFLAYHANFAPRYYLVLAVPLSLLLAMGFDALLQAALRPRSGLAWPWMLRIAAIGSTITLLWILVSGARQTLDYVAHPEYSYLTAVHHLRDAIERDRTADPQHSRLVLSISGSDISLVSGLPSIDDDFGTMELPDRVAAYKPGWFAAWNDIEDDKMAALAPMYRVVRVGAWPAYDDPERNQLILYRLDPVDSPRRGRTGRRRYFLNPHRRVRKAARPATAPDPPAPGD